VFGTLSGLRQKTKLDNVRPYVTEWIVINTEKRQGTGHIGDGSSIMRLFARHMARQLRYVMELGFDACFRFYQFPVTHTLCSRLARCVPHPVSVSDETLITSCLRCHGFFSRDIGFTVRRYMTRSADGLDIGHPVNFLPRINMLKLNYKLFYANSTND